MYFQFDVMLTEEDYLVFNDFHAIHSPSGKKTVRRSRIVFAALMVALALLFFVLMGFTTFTIIYGISLCVYTGIYLVFFPKVIKRNIRKNLKRALKAGKPPFDPYARLEFYDDRYADISPGKRTEMQYSVIDRICVIENRYIYLYISSIQATIIPIPQLLSRYRVEDFLYFLSQKCPKVEHYSL